MLKVLFVFTFVFTTLQASAQIDPLGGLPPSTMNNDLEGFKLKGNINHKKTNNHSAKQAIEQSADVKKALGKKISIESETLNKDGSRTFNVFGETHMAQVQVNSQSQVKILSITEIDGEEPAATTNK